MAGTIAAINTGKIVDPPITPNPENLPSCKDPELDKHKQNLVENRQNYVVRNCACLDEICTADKPVCDWVSGTCSKMPLGMTCKDNINCQSRNCFVRCQPWGTLLGA